MEEVQTVKTHLIMSKICRSCMNESNELQPLFTKLEFVGLETQLSDMLIACSSVQISSTDGLPSSLCRVCVHQLSNAFSFKQQCETTDFKLREYLNSIDTEPDPDPEPDFNIKQEAESCNIVVKPDIDLSDINAADDTFDETCDNGNDDWDLSEDEALSEKIKKNSENSHQCHICLKKLSSSVGLKLHLRKHQNEKCDLCEKSFDKLADLKAHKLQIHDVCKADESIENSVKIEKEDSDVPELGKRTRKVKVEPELNSFECTECHKVLSSLNGLQIHQRRHTGKNLAPCYLCTKTFTKLSHLKRHLLVHGIDNPTAADIRVEQGKNKKESYQCEFCDRKFVYKKSFTHHMKTEHAMSEEEPPEDEEVPKGDQELEENGNDKPDEEVGEEEDGKEYDCHVCNQKFTRANHLTRHMTLHRNILNQKCTHCEKVFLTPEHLETHINESHKEKSYSCISCGTKFTRGEHLIRHLKTEHAKQSDALTCSICAKQFPNADQLAKHIKQHIQQDKRHICPICNKAFNRLDNLRTHQRVHTGEVAVRLHLCVYCGKEFNNSSNMIVHMRRHTGERPYKCEVCGKGFPRSHDLKCHERTHSGERPYLCTLCGKSFNKSNKLVRHTRVHTGERPYVCSLCGRAFTQSNDLALHMRRHTGSRPYACGICPARFIQSGQLKTHRRTQGHWVEQEIQFRGNRVEPVHIEGLVETKIKYRKPRSTPNSAPNPLLIKNINLLTNNTEGNFGLPPNLGTNREEVNPSQFEPSSTTFEAVPTTSASFQTGFNFPQFG